MLINLVALLGVAGVLVGAAGCAASGQSVTLRIALDRDASDVTAQAVAHLPSTVSFDDQMGTVHVAELDAALPVDWSRGTGEGRTGPLTQGDLVYWPSGPALLVVLVDGVEAPRGGVVVLGEVHDGFDALLECASGCVTELHVEHGTRGRDR